MNKRGFTLVEVITVIALLGLIIGLAVPNVMKSSIKAKQRTLNTKIKNIEKAAVLYGQDNRKLINKKIESKIIIANMSNKNCLTLLVFFIYDSFYIPIEFIKHYTIRYAFACFYS